MPGEGGFYRETYRSKFSTTHTSSRKNKNKVSLDNARSTVTLICYLLDGRGHFSAFHRLKSDEIWHSQFGKIQYADDYFSAIDIMKTPYISDLLMEALNLFNASKSFQRYMLEPRGNERMQVTGVSWMFDILGWRTISLGIVSDHDEKTIQTQPEHSCDILAVSDSSPQILLTIDCTMTVPPQNKIIKIYNTAEYIAKTLKEQIQMDLHVIPAIISSAECKGLDTTSSQVLLVDKNDLNYLHDQIVKGLKDDAKQMLNDRIAFLRDLKD